MAWTCLCCLYKSTTLLDGEHTLQPAPQPKRPTASGDSGEPSRAHLRCLCRCLGYALMSRHARSCAHQSEELWVKETMSEGERW